MRVWQLAAVAVAAMTTHVAPASAEVTAPAGLESGAGTGGADAQAVQPGPQLGSDYRIAATAVATTPDKAPKLRRIGSMMDFYPVGNDLGFHLSAGIHRMAKAGRGVAGLFKATRSTSLIYSPAAAEMLPLRTGIKRTAPAFSAGWTRAIDRHMLVGFEAGTTFDHGGGRAFGGAAVHRWSRVDPVAQASFAWRF